MNRDYKHGYADSIKKSPSDDSMEAGEHHMQRDTSKILVISDIDDLDRTACPKSPLLKGMGLDLSFTTALSQSKVSDDKDYEESDGKGVTYISFRN